MSMPITNGVSSYNLFQELGADLPPDKLQFATGAYLGDGSGTRVPLTIVQRRTYEEIPNLGQSGRPSLIYIDRLPIPTLSIWPTPAASDLTHYSIDLTVQRYAPNVAPGGVTGTNISGSILTGFSVAWRRYLIWQLAHDLGCGPIIKLPEASLNRFGRLAGEAKSELLAIEDREQDTEPPVCAPWGMF